MYMRGLNPNFSREGAIILFFHVLSTSRPLFFTSKSSYMSCNCAGTSEKKSGKSGRGRGTRPPTK